MTHGIAITGSGIVCAIGTDKATVANSLRKGIGGVGTMQHLTSTHKELPVGEVMLSNDALKDALAINLQETISRTTLLGAYALKQAIEDAGLTAKQLNHKRVAFISGTTVAGMDITEQHYHGMTLGEQTACQYIRQHDCGSNSNDIARLLGLECEITTISTACSSALNAIIVGTRMLLANETDIVIAGGTESLSTFHLNGFNSLMILDHKPCRPFDKTRQGLNLGEGAAYVVLERTDDIKRHVDIQAYIAGYGNRCDAFHQTASSDNGEGAFLAMNDALTMADIMPQDVDYINAHGTGTPNNDQTESAAIKRLFGNNTPPTSSTKAYTGHTTSASGSIETVICLIAMQQGFTPTNLRWTEPDETCITPVATITPQPLHHVLCNAFGFGGNDSSLLLSDVEKPLHDIIGSNTKIIAQSEVNTDEELSGLKEFISPMESRRMGKLLKAALLTSLRCLKEANIEQPDAIIVATRFGQFDHAQQLLDTLSKNGEEGISPTLFMQSTHNTIAGTLAIRLHCHGYNITYSQGNASFDWALRDARKLLAEGKAKTVLVGWHDECPETFRRCFEIIGDNVPTPLYSKSIILTQ
ncbi:MAG: beta-ketoacyl synthase N-terminal-like domain-containing protein [Bacteroidales bacterium]|nr:beta-ketoacyl synthase N-terminal-like domain-containing protein [Bacteroidales bacterium]